MPAGGLASQAVKDEAETKARAGPEMEGDMAADILAELGEQGLERARQLECGSVAHQAELDAYWEQYIAVKQEFVETVLQVLESPE